jgi:hypothetical protein
MCACISFVPQCTGILLKIKKECVMKTKYSLIVVVALAISSTGCTVGRYVTNVTSSGPNKVSVEKCTTKAYGNFYWNEECSETTLNLQPSSTSK